MVNWSLDAMEGFKIPLTGCQCIAKIYYSIFAEYFWHYAVLVI